MVQVIEPLPPPFSAATLTIPGPKASDHGRSCLYVWDQRPLSLTSMSALPRGLLLTETVKLVEELIPAALLGCASTPLMITPIRKRPAMTMRTPCHHFNFRSGG